MSFATVIPEIASHVASEVFSPHHLPHLTAAASNYLKQQQTLDQYKAQTRQQVAYYQNRFYRPIEQVAHYRVPSPLQPGQYLRAIVQPPVHNHLQTIHRSDGRTQVVQKKDSVGWERFLPLILVTSAAVTLTALILAIVGLVKRR